MNPPIRLLLVDDHLILRVGLENILSSNRQFQIVGSAEDAASAMVLFRELRPDVTLLDVNMPGTNGIECLAQIRGEFPEARVLMLSSSEVEEDVVRTMELGALGYVFKTASAAELTQAVLSAHEGNRVTAPEVEARLADRASTVPLTARELEVLQLLRKGLSNADIARLLGITHRTARAHVGVLLVKLEASDRTGAVTRAFERGLLKL